MRSGLCLCLALLCFSCYPPKRGAGGSAPQVVTNPASGLVSCPSGSVQMDKQLTPKKEKRISLRIDYEKKITIHKDKLKR